MVKSKVHSAWRLKRLVKQPAWKCFLPVVLDGLCKVVTLSLSLETLGQAAMLKMFPTRCTRRTLHSVNTWSTLVKSKVHQAWRLNRLVKQPCWRCFPLVVLDGLYIVLTHEAHWWTTRYTKLDAWKAWSSGQLASVSYSLLNRLCTVVTPEEQWWRARYTQLDAWNAWSSNQLENVSYSLY